MEPTPNRYPPLLIEEDHALGPPRAVWLFFLSIVIAKVAVIAVVFATDFSPLSVLYFFITTWFWVVAGIVLMAGPTAMAIRLRKVRKRRTALQRAEWIIDE